MKTSPLDTSPMKACESFIFSGKPRKIEPVQPLPWTKWPTKIAAANDYVLSWQELAKRTLQKLKLSYKTMETIASHVGRRDGSCPLTDRALAARSERSLASTKRDVQRLKSLGFLIIEHSPAKGRQGRERTLKIAIPDMIFEDQRIPPSCPPDCVSTYPTYVDAFDMGDRRNV